MSNTTIKESCRVCNASYTRSHNPNYEKWTYELKYICEDGKHKYYSNKFIGCCPTCVVTGRNNERS